MQKLSLKKKIIFSIIIIGIIFFIIDKSIAIYDKKIKPYFKTKAAIIMDENMPSEEQQRDYNKVQQLKLYPYLMFRIEPNIHTKHVNINSLGFRGKEIKKEKDRNVFRIVFLGGSAGFGIGVFDDDSTFCSLFEKKLNKGFKGKEKYEVINACIPSYISMQELILLEMKVLDLKPDMVVVFDGFNDVLTSIKRDRRPGFPYMFKNLEKAVGTSSSKRGFRKALKKIRIARKIMEMREKKEMKHKYESNYPALDIYRNNLDTMCHLLKSYNIKPVLVFQPVIDFKKPMSKREKMIIEADETNYHEIAYPMYIRASKKMKETAEINNVKFLNYLSLFNDTEETIFTDDVHFNDSGHQIVADNLCGDLINLYQ